MVVIAVPWRRRRLWQWLGRAVIVLAVSAALWFLPGSRGDWAGVLGILVLVWWELGPWRGKLHPFRVRVQPKWSAILADHDVIPQEQVASALLPITSAKGSAQASYSPLTHGIGFTTLDVDLGYHDDRHCFFTELDIEEPIPEWRQPIPDVLLPPSVEPTLYVALTGDPVPGYALGITTPQSALKSHLPGDKGNRIKLATLPSLALADHWDTVDAILNRRRQAEKDAAITKCGWRRIERYDEDTPETEPECLEHKYFTVYHISI